MIFAEWQNLATLTNVMCCSPASSWLRRSPLTDERPRARFCERNTARAYVLMNNQRRKLIERWGTRSFWRCIGPIDATRTCPSAGRVHIYCDVLSLPEILTCFYQLKCAENGSSARTGSLMGRLRFAHSPN
jgi:hypothetical protein